MGRFIRHSKIPRAFYSDIECPPVGTPCTAPFFVPDATFELTNSLPPTRFADNSFDLLNLYSVFSHLSEEAHDCWLTEFRRITTPGGFASQRPGRANVQRLLQTACSCGDKQVAPTLDRYLRSRKRRQRSTSMIEGEPCYSPMGGGEALPGSFYGETCIPADYVKKHWTDRFSFREFISDERCAQNVRYL